MSVIEETVPQRSVTNEVPPALPAASRCGRTATIWRLWGGQVVSSVGSQVSGLALPLLILALTHSPAKAGLLAALRGVPYFLLVPARRGAGGPLGPAPGDAFLRHGPGAGPGEHPARPRAGPPGAVAAFRRHVRRGDAVRVLQPGRIELPGAGRLEGAAGAAVAQNEAVYGVSGLIGPSLGGLLYGLGRGVPFLADAISYALSVAALLTLKTDVRPAPRRAGDTPHLGREIGEGLRWLCAHRVIRFVALLTGVLMALLRGLGADPDRAGAAVWRDARWPSACCWRPAGRAASPGRCWPCLCRSGPVRAADDRRGLGLGNDLAALRAGARP